MRLPFFSPIFSIVLLSATSHAADPWKISYDKAPGYHESSCSQNLEWSYRSSLSADDEPSVPISKAPPSGLRIKWFGTSGLEIGDDRTTILLDPFVTRPEAGALFLLQPLSIDTGAVDRQVLASLDLKKLKVILNSHTHHDHAQDIPYVLANYKRAGDRPLVVGDSNMRCLLDLYKAPSARIAWLLGIDALSLTPQYIIDFDQARKERPPAGRPIGFYVGTFGDFKITAYINDHTLYDHVSFFKLDGQVDDHPPLRSTEYLSYLNSTLNYLIEYKGFRIFSTDSADFLNSARIAREVGHVDLLFQGVAARENNDSITQFIAGLQPRYLIATHFDNFAMPFEKMTEFDYTIPLLGDQAKFAPFLTDFEPRYVKEAAKIAGPGFVSPKLRLLKALYYYSLDGLL